MPPDPASSTKEPLGSGLKTRSKRGKSPTLLPSQHPKSISKNGRQDHDAKCHIPSVNESSKVKSETSKPQPSHDIQVEAMDSSKPAYVSVQQKGKFDQSLDLSKSHSNGFSPLTLDNDICHHSQVKLPLTNLDQSLVIVPTPYAHEQSDPLEHSQNANKDHDLQKNGESNRLNTTSSDHGDIDHHIPLSEDNITAKQTTDHQSTSNLEGNVEPQDKTLNTNITPSDSRSTTDAKLSPLSSKKDKPSSTKDFPSIYNQARNSLHRNEVESISSTLFGTLSEQLEKISLNLKIQPLVPNNFDKLCRYLLSGQCRNVIVLAGAGMSVDAGIPDFRSQSTGLYHQLSHYKLPTPESIFDLSYFCANPKPFFHLARTLYPGQFKPTWCHYFIHLLHKKNILRRLYTQNVDTLELLAGIPEDKVVFAHGSFSTNHCIRCNKEYPLSWTKIRIFASKIPKCETCRGVVKPDIVFFGEPLPKRFFQLIPADFPVADLFIVIGTSLKVYPVSDLLSYVPPNCIRVLINDTYVRSASPDSKGSLPEDMSKENNIFHWDRENTRDIALIGDCQERILHLTKEIGWHHELEKLKLEQEAALGLRQQE